MSKIVAYTNYVTIDKLRPRMRQQIGNLRFLISHHSGPGGLVEELACYYGNACSLEELALLY